MSVTYGAGGGTSQYTVQIAKGLNDMGVTALAHLTCISSDRDNVRGMLAKLKEEGIENILALRGDILPDTDMSKLSYHYADELVREIRDFGGFCVGGACYPEGHPDSENSRTDIENLKRKVDAGCEFLTTQMFFDNNVLYNFMYRIQKAGIYVPVVAGVMPVINARQIKRICSISANALPQRSAHSRPLCRQSRCYEAGRHCLRNRTGHRFVCKRCKRRAHLFYEQSVGCRRNKSKYFGNTKTGELICRHRFP